MSLVCKSYKFAIKSPVVLIWQWCSIAPKWDGWSTCIL